MSLFVFFNFTVFLVVVNCVMIKKECPDDEIHKSCKFHEEYSCWVDETKSSRVNTAPKRLIHCQSGCYCKKGWVRAYPKGPCLVAYQCRNQKLQDTLEKLPSNFNVY